MGSVGFYWQDSREPLHELQLVQLKEEGRVIKKPTWWDEEEETKDIYAAKDERTRGTFLGVSKRGRVACLIKTLFSTALHTRAELLPVMFLKGNMSPEEFADELKRDKNLSSGLAFYLIVADIPSKSMFYISKEYTSAETVKTRVVGPGFHHVHYRNGLDDHTFPVHDRKILSNRITDKGLKDLSLEDRQTESLKLVDGQEGHYGSTEVHITATGKIRFWDLLLLDDNSEVVDDINFDME